MTRDSDSPEKSGEQARASRRVKWTQPGAADPLDVDDESLDTTAEDWPDRELNPDEKLTRDKPPHWK